MYYLILFLIFNLVYANDVLLDEKKTKCAESCYSVSKPLLSYIPKIHKRLKDCEGLQPPYPQERLDKMESQLNQIKLRTNQQIQSMEEQALSLKKRCEDQIKTYVDCEVNQRNLNNSVPGYQKQIEDIKIEKQAKEEKLAQCKSKLEEQKLKEKERKKKFGKFLPIGLKYYYAEKKQEVTWFEAYQDCILQGAHLASPENEDELEILAHFSRTFTMRIWIGIHGNIVPGKFISTTTGEPAKYLKWNEGEPNHANDNENCVELLTESGLMNDQSCSQYNNYICVANIDS